MQPRALLLTLALVGTLACERVEPPPPAPPAEFLVAAGDSVFWIRSEADGIRVREGLELDIAVPWEEFASISRVDHRIDPSDPKRPKGRILDLDGERVCSIRVANETNLEILFEKPTPVRLPGLPPKGGAHTVTRLRFWADDPRGFLTEVRKQLE